MITRIDVYKDQTIEPILSIPMIGVSKEPIQILDIDGLTPVRATINTLAYGGSIGETYIGSSTGKRNITMTFGLSPDWATQTVSSLRELLYRYFMPETQLLLVFARDDFENDALISGYVEGMDTVLFSKNPEVQVSFICPDPIFTEYIETSYEGVTQLSNSGTAFDLLYTGNYPTGFRIQVKSSAAVPSFTGNIAIAEAAPMGAGEVKANGVTINASQYLEMSTKKGNKYLRYQDPPGVHGTDILSKLASPVSWLQLKPGVNMANHFIVYGVAGLNFSIRYYRAYGGL